MPVTWSSAEVLDSSSRRKAVTAWQWLSCPMLARLRATMSGCKCKSHFPPNLVTKAESRVNMPRLRPPVRGK